MKLIYSELRWWFILRTSSVIGVDNRFYGCYSRRRWSWLQRASMMLHLADTVWHWYEQRILWLLFAPYMKLMAASLNYDSCRVYVWHWYDGQVLKIGMMDRQLGEQSHTVLPRVSWVVRFDPVQIMPVHWQGADMQLYTSSDVQMARCSSFVFCMCFVFGLGPSWWHFGMCLRTCLDLCWTNVCDISQVFYVYMKEVGNTVGPIIVWIPK